MMTTSPDTTTYAIGAFPTFVYILASFIANVGVSVTGFGMALIFVFVVTLLDAATGFDDENNSCTPAAICDTKHTVFVQSLSLLGSVPFLMLKAKIHKHAHYGLLATLIPVTLVATPAGQYLQSKVSSAWICIVLGVVISIVVVWKLVDLRWQQQQRNNSVESEPLLKKESTREEQSPLVTSSISTLATEEENFYGSVDNVGGDTSNSNHNESISSSLLSKKVVVWGILLGFASGFLGGLIGMRGPPLMVFFLVFPFPKTETRAVGAIMLFLNMVLRISYYGVDDYRRRNNELEGSSVAAVPWFLGSSAWPLYVGVVVAGILGVPIGDWIHHRIDQTKFKIVLGLLLAASGIVNIAKGVAELRQ